MKAKHHSVHTSNMLVGHLEETLEFLEGQEDVDEGQPNKAMRLATDIRATLAEMGAPQGMETPRTADRLEAAALAASLVADHGWEPADALELVDRQLDRSVRSVYAGLPRILRQGGASCLAGRRRASAGIHVQEWSGNRLRK